MARRRKMTDEALANLVLQRSSDVHGISGGTLASDRKKALQYYRGDKFGNEQDGRSQVVSHDVAEAIDSVMPSIMRIFAAGDQVVAFEPHGPEDEQSAQQATDYINLLWERNQGFRIFYWWFKDALMQRQGVVKVWWDESEEVTREEYKGLTEEQAQMVRDDQDIEVVEKSEPYPDPSVAPALDPMSGQPMPPPMVFDLVVSETNRDGRVRVENVPPEEFGLSRRARTVEDADYTHHRVQKTLSELRAMGYEQKLLDKIPSDEVYDLSEEKLVRFERDDGEAGQEIGTLDPAMRKVWVTEAYLKVDYDGDGIAEMRKVCVAGSIVLDNEEVDENPFAACTPVLMPHKAVGMSMADQTMDLQLIKSTLLRQFLDNTYLQSAPALGVDENAVTDFNELLTRRVGQVVRFKGPPGQAMMPIPTQFIGGELFPAIEYMDTVREQRTGSTRYNQGLDADSLNKTAKGIGLIQNASMQRIELIARSFAETGVITAFRKMLKLTSQHQDKAEVVRLRGKWVNVDPRAWKNGFDATVSVGLGTGNKDQQLQTMMGLLNIDKSIIELQQGIQGPLLTADGIYNKLKKLIEAAGLKSIEQYYSDPSSQEMKQLAAQPKPPSKEQIDAQGKAEEHKRNVEIKDKDVQIRSIDLAIAEIEARTKVQALLNPEPQQIEQPDPLESRDRDLKQRAQDLENRKLDMTELSLTDPQPKEGEGAPANGQAPTKAVGQLAQILASLQASQQQLQQSQQQQTEMLAQLMRVMAAPKIGQRMPDGKMMVQTDMSGMMN